MKIWQADFYRTPQRDATGQILWELLLTDTTRSFEYTAICLQSQANSTWITSQLELEYEPKRPNNGKTPKD